MRYDTRSTPSIWLVIPLHLLSNDSVECNPRSCSNSCGAFPALALVGVLSGGEAACSHSLWTCAVHFHHMVRKVVEQGRSGVISHRPEDGSRNLPRRPDGDEFTVRLDRKPNRGFGMFRKFHQKGLGIAQVPLARPRLGLGLELELLFRGRTVILST